MHAISVSLDLNGHLLVKYHTMPDCTIGFSITKQLMYHYLCTRMTLLFSIFDGSISTAKIANVLRYLKKGNIDKVGVRITGLVTHTRLRNRIQLLNIHPVNSLQNLVCFNMIISHSSKLEYRPNLLNLPSDVNALI